MDFTYIKNNSKRPENPHLEKVSFWAGRAAAASRIDMIAAAKGAGAMTQMITNGCC